MLLQTVFIYGCLDYIFYTQKSLSKRKGLNYYKFEIENPKFEINSPFAS